MGKHRVNILLCCTAVFAAFTLGFFLGRNYNHDQVQICATSLSAPVSTQTPATSSAAPSTEPDAATEAETLAAQPTDVYSETPTTADSSGRLNINTASAAQLQNLPGIGEVIAQRIVEYRNTYGDFQTVYALTNVKGIGEKRLAAIIDLITIQEENP